MKKQVILGVIHLLFSQCVLAQFQLNGSIKDKNTGIEYATIALHPVADSTALQGVLSDENGQFSFKDLSTDTYKLVVQMLGYEDWEQTIALNENITLPTIKLEASTTLLKTVEVLAEKSYLTSKLGKKELFIGADLASTGSTALEALERVPSISIGARGKVLLRGSSNIIIYVNGKQTQRDAASLQYLSASMLEKIEIITNPSAKYDAEGVAGIINLVMKKEKTQELKLAALLNVSYPTAYGGGINASLQRNNLSFHLNYSDDFTTYGGHSINERRNDRDELQGYKSNIRYDGKEHSRAINTEISFEPDSTLSMGLEWNYDLWDDKEETFTTNFFDYRTQADKTLNTENATHESEHEMSLSFSMNKLLKKDGTWNILLLASGENEQNTADFLDGDFADAISETGRFVDTQRERERQRLYQAKFDFEAPFFDFGTYETGIKYDYIRNTINQKIRPLSEDFQVPENDFLMELDKLGAYFIQTHQLNRFEYSVGLRLEQFASSSIQYTDNTTFSQRYLRLFPSLQLQYELPDENQTIGLSYTRRIKRPSFWNINPYWNYSDPLNLSTGNPNLRPAIADLLEFNYHKNMESLSFDCTLYQRLTKDVIQEFVTVYDAQTTLSSFINFQQRRSRGIEVQVEHNANKVLKTTLSFVLAQIQFKDDEQQLPFATSQTWNLRLRQQYKFPQTWTFQWSGYYRAARFQAQVKTLARYSIDGTLKKQFHNKRGTISLRMRDIFNIKEFNREYRGEIIIDQFEKWQTQRFTLGLRYAIFE